MGGLRLGSWTPPVLLTAAALAACTGVLGDPSATSESAGSSDGTGSEAQALLAPSAGLRRLTVAEYRATVSDLLGVDPFGDDAPQPDTPVDGFVSIGARTVAYSAKQVERFEQAAYDAARLLVEDSARRLEVVGCTPEAGDDACVQEFLTRFVRRAFRRPATDEELSTYKTLVATVAAEADPWLGLGYAVAAILQAPDFLYRVELGEAEGSGEVRRLTPFELATRLSYLVTGSTPDDELLDAAERGDLDDEEGLLRELDRLMALPQAETALSRFLAEQWDLDHVSKIVKLPEAFPNFTPALADAMQREMDQVFREVALREPDDLLSILSRRETYVNGPLAELYGIPGPTSADEWVPVTWPEDGPRAGLLGFAGFLASHAGASETSVTKRGFFVVAKLLCREIPPPPGDVVTVLPEPPEGGHVTMRERVEQHMSNSECRNCHGLMDPPGLALEHFDALGVYRETDGGLSIDATGVLDEESFDGARELGELLARHPAVSQCVTRRFYEFALGSRAGKNAAVSELVTAFEDGGRRFPELVRALVTHEVFRLASAPR